jgi:peroxiredoxin Q/BCP
VQRVAFAFDSIMKLPPFKIFLISGILCSTSHGLTTGTEVPIFTALDDTENRWSLSKAVQKSGIVLFFYPAAMTAGCTKQACGFQDDHKLWRSSGFEVIGISGDQPKNLSLFKKVHGISYKMLSDPEGKIAEKFGVPTGKGGKIDRFIDGEKYSLHRGVTSKRWTFVISAQGKILLMDKQVRAASNSQDLLKLLDLKQKP